MFAGRKSAAQRRGTAAEKADKNNYLEGANAVAFTVPTAGAANFAGVSAFNWRTPSADVVRCLP